MKNEAAKSVEGLFKTIIATAGVMLPLLWGLTQFTQLTQPSSTTINPTINPTMLATIRFASVILLVSIVASIIGCQFIITALAGDAANITKQKRVAFSFLAAWITFILGGVLVITAIFQFG